MKASLGAVIGIAALLVARPALAQGGGGPAGSAECPEDAVGCHTQDVDFHHRDTLFNDVSLDSGWVPSGSPLQVRFGVLVGGRTELDMGGTAVTSWPDALDVALPGRPSAGRFAFNYGFEIVAQIRIDVKILGIHYTYEGDIPVPGGIPEDLRVSAEALFDPFALPPADPRPITAWDDTDRVTVFTVGLGDDIIPIPGIGGAFRVDAVGSLEGSYQTERIEISDATSELLEEGASTTVLADPGADDFGGEKDYTVQPHGTIHYDGAITLYPSFYIEILGKRFDLDLFELPLHIANVQSEVDLEPASVHVPLPAIRVVPTSLWLGERMVGETREGWVTIYNDGEADLEVMVAEVPAQFAVGTSSLTIPPRSAQLLVVRFAPTDPGDASGVLLLATNDPDDPFVSIDVSGTAVAPPDAGIALDAGVDAGVGFDAGMDIDAGTGGDMATGTVLGGACGCRAAGGQSPAPSAPIALGLVALALRWRRRRSSP
jgi:MYXO-CTERM domain-containing protein